MKRILFIDDEVTVRHVIRRGLELAGYEVLEAENGKHVSELLLEHHVDLVITDLIMPEVEGIELIHSLRSIYPDVPIIAISGGGCLKPDNYLAVAEAIGANATLAKPFKIKELVYKVRKLIG